MLNVSSEHSFKNMSDLTIKKIEGIYKTKTPAKEQIEKYKRHRKEFKNDLTGIYIHEDIASSIIMDCRTPKAIAFRRKSGVNQHYLIMTIEQSVLTKIMKVFSSKEILLSILF